MFLEAFPLLQEQGGTTSPRATSLANRCSGQLSVQYGDPLRFSTGNLPQPIVVDSSRNEEQTFLDSRNPGGYESRECLCRIFTAMTVNRRIAVIQATRRLTKPTLRPSWRIRCT